MKEHWEKALIRVVLVVMIAFLQTTAHAAFVHPGVPFTTYDLERMKANRTVEPWKSGYAVLTASSQASLTYTMQGPFAEVGREPNLNLGQYQSDSTAVLYQAIQYYMTGNTSYATKAIQILNAWTTTHTTWSGGTPFLAATDYGSNFVMGAEILRYTYPGWTSATTTNCQNYFQNMLWPQFAVGTNTTLRAANQGAAQLKGAIAVAVFCDNQTEFDQVIAAWHDNACGGLGGTSLATGQVADSGRDQGHALGEIGNHAFVAETAWKQNLDLFGELNNRLLVESEYFCQYNLGDTVPFATFGACYGLYTTIGSGGRGPWSWSPMMLEIMCGAYVIRKGMSAPYTTQFRTATAPNVDTFLYRKDGLSPPTQPAKPPIAPMPPSAIATAPVTSLSNADVGSVGSAGSGSYSGGVWTVNGSGADIWNSPDSFHFTYRQITGNAVLVARVTSVETTNINAKAGLMVRETLNANSTYATVYLKPGTAGAEFASRVTTGAAVSNNQAHGPANPMPYWLKIERIGNLITAYNSFDGATWTPMRVVSIPMAATVYVGLVVCAHDNTQLNTSTFDNVAIGTPGVAATPDGNYTLTNGVSGLLADDKGNGTSPGTPVDQATATGGAGQIWTLKNLGSGNIRLTNTNSNLVMEVLSGSLTKGATIDQWTLDSGANKIWHLSALGGGYYSLTNLNSGLFLEDPGNSKATGIVLDQWTWNGGTNQQWLLKTAP